MTEKRFKVYKVIGSFHEWSVEDTVDDKVVFDNIMCKYSADKVCNKLNELNDEKEELKEERDYFERKKCEYFNKYNKKHLDTIQLKEENEELNEFIYELYKKYEDAHGMSIENEDWF